MFMLLLSVITVNSLDDIGGQTFTDVLDDLARDSLGLQEIQVTTRIHTHTHYSNCVQWHMSFMSVISATTCDMWP